MKKQIKAWGVINNRIDSLGKSRAVFWYKAHAMKEMKRINAQKVVPCTITYSTKEKE